MCYQNTGLISKKVTISLWWRTRLYNYKIVSYSTSLIGQIFEAVNHWQSSVINMLCMFKEKRDMRSHPRTSKLDRCIVTISVMRCWDNVWSQPNVVCWKNKKYSSLFRHYRNHNAYQWLVVRYTYHCIHVTWMMKIQTKDACNK